MEVFPWELLLIKRTSVLNSCTKLQTVNTTKGTGKEQNKPAKLLNEARVCLPTKIKHVNKSPQENEGKKNREGRFNYSTSSQRKPHGLCEISFVLLVRSRKLCSRSNVFREAVLLIAAPG